MSNTYALSNAKNAFDRAATEFEKQKAYLFRRDGTKVYTETEHKERMATLLRPLTEAAANVKQVSDEAIAAARAAKAVRHADPITSLSSADLVRASYLKAFVEDAVSGMSLSELGERLSAVAIDSDKAQIACYFAAASKRTQTLRDASRSGAQVDMQGISAVSEHLSTLAGKLADPKQAQALEEAAKLEREAFEVSGDVYGRTKELSGEQEAAMARRRAQYQAMF